LYLKNWKQFPLAIGESPSEKRLRQQESKLFDGEFVEIRGLIIKRPGEIMPVKFYGLFGQSHGLELELKKQIKRSIKENILFHNRKIFKRNFRNH